MVIFSQSCDEVPWFILSVKKSLGVGSQESHPESETIFLEVCRQIGLFDVEDGVELALPAGFSLVIFSISFGISNLANILYWFSSDVGLFSNGSSDDCSEGIIRVIEILSISETSLSDIAGNMSELTTVGILRQPVLSEGKPEFLS